MFLAACLVSGCGGAAGNGSDGGVTTASCASPASACGEMCVDLQNDPMNCGACGQACAAEHVNNALCVFGVCGYDECAAGYADCDSDIGNGCELPVDADVANCGGCGLVCAPANATTPTCAAGACGYASCAAGHADCDNDATNGCEVDVTTDDRNCGTCGRSCGVDETCQSGVCTLVCTSPLTACPAVGMTPAFCTLVDDDPDNCGTCGHVCKPLYAQNAACSKGACTYDKCDINYGDCDGDPSNGCETCLICKTDNCGGCGIKCEAVHTTGVTCNGTCVWTDCAAGWANCDANAGNGCETPDSDTTCGTSCDNCTLTGLHCVSGRCG